MDISHYLELVYQHLDDPSTYARLPTDPTQETVSELLVLLQRLLSAGVIDQTTYPFLCPANPTRTQRLYMYFLPKLHKDPLAMRPIVSCCSSPTETLSAFPDYFFTVTGVGSTIVSGELY